MDGQQRNGSFRDGGKMKMTIPERIVLSAGYDGDDNQDVGRIYNDTSTFDETPIINPDDVMAGMQTPPSVLTIDHSSHSYKDHSPNWHTEGDGADNNENQSAFQRYSQQLRDDLLSQDDNEFSELMPQERSVVIAGQETDYPQHIPFDDPREMRKWYLSTQRRIALLENELDYQNRVMNVWKYFLLTLSVINPFIINYFFFSRRR